MTNTTMSNPSLSKAQKEAFDSVASFERARKAIFKPELRVGLSSAHWEHMFKGSCERINQVRPQTFKALADKKLIILIYPTRYKELRRGFTPVLTERGQYVYANGKYKYII